MPQQNHYTPPQKVDEAVTSAFDRAGAETQNYVPPELIAQITQNVIKQLQSGGLDGTIPINPQNSFSPPPPIQQPVPLPPSTASGTSTNVPNQVFPRRRHKSIKTTPTIARQSRTQDSLCRMALLALLSPEQLPSVRLEEPRHLRAKQAMRAKSQSDQKVHQGSRQARRKLHWREYGASCSTKRVIPRSGLANYYVASLCT